MPKNNINIYLTKTETSQINILIYHINLQFFIIYHINLKKSFIILSYFILLKISLVIKVNHKFLLRIIIENDIILLNIFI